jgi:hypothetical protein
MDRLAVHHLGVQGTQELRAVFFGDQVQRLLVHWAIFPIQQSRIAIQGNRIAQVPAECVQGAIVGTRIMFQPFFEARTMVDFEEPTGPCSNSTRRSVP